METVINKPDTKHYQVISLDHLRLRDCLNMLKPPRVFWAEPGHPPLLASGASIVLSAEKDNRFDSIREQARLINLKNGASPEETIPRSAKPRFFGGFSFFHDSADSSRWSTFQRGRFMLPRMQLTETAGKVWLTVIGDSPEENERAIERFREAMPPGKRPEDLSARHAESLRQHPTRKEWIDITNETVDIIQDGQLDKLVLARAMDIQTDRPLTTEYLHGRLEEAPENTYRFLFNPKQDQNFLGATPENLVERRGEIVRTESLAGTIEAGETEQETRKLAKNLASSTKDQAEHRLVVNTLKEHLEQRVSQLRFGDQTVRRFPSVQHLYTPIKGVLKEPVHILELVKLLHPTPAVGGSPDPEFQSHLSRLEPFPRGWYASPVGWFNSEGDGRFAVAIRSALVNGRDARLYAGAGIVSDSEPEKEWDEVQWKFQSLLNVLLP